MTIKNIVNFYLDQYQEIDINIEMLGGMKGTEHRYTKETFNKELADFCEDIEPIAVNFQTHAYNTISGYSFEFDYPKLYITYEKKFELPIDK